MGGGDDPKIVGKINGQRIAEGYEPVEEEIVIQVENQKSVVAEIRVTLKFVPIADNGKVYYLFDHAVTASDDMSVKYDFGVALDINNYKIDRVPDGDDKQANWETDIRIDVVVSSGEVMQNSSVTGAFAFEPKDGMTGTITAGYSQTVKAGGYKKTATFRYNARNRYYSDGPYAYKKGMFEFPFPSQPSQTFTVSDGNWWITHGSDEVKVETDPKGSLEFIETEINELDNDENNDTPDSGGG